MNNRIKIPLTWNQHRGRIKVTAEKEISATGPEYDALMFALVTADEWQIEVDHDEDTGDLSVFSRDFPPDIPWGFVQELGKIIANNGLLYLEFGASWACPNLCLGSQGGSYFRIMNDGSIWFPKLTWDETSIFTQEEYDAECEKRFQ